MKKVLLCSVLMCGMGGGCFASLLSPGDIGATPDPLSISGMTLLTSETVPLDSLTFDATLTAAVYSGNNVFCPTSDCMTFVYQVSDTSAISPATGIIEHLTASSFTGYSTDVGDQTLTTASGPFAAGGVAPQTVDRSADGPGSVVTFDYPNNGNNAQDLVPGNYTDLLIVETDALTYANTGLFSAIDGATVTQFAYAPATPSSTPEPMTFLLTGFGLVGIGLVFRRPKSTKVTD